MVFGGADNVENLLTMWVGKERLRRGPLLKRLRFLLLGQCSEGANSVEVDEQVSCLWLRRKKACTVEDTGDIWYGLVLTDIGLFQRGCRVLQWLMPDVGGLANGNRGMSS